MRYTSSWLERFLNLPHVFWQHDKIGLSPWKAVQLSLSIPEKP